MLINKILWLKAYLLWELELVPVKKKPGAGQKQTSFATLIALNRCELARGMQVQTWPTVSSTCGNAHGGAMILQA